MVSHNKPSLVRSQKNFCATPMKLLAKLVVALWGCELEF